MTPLIKTNFKMFFYNLIIFDFIFLSSVNKKKSNFHLEQVTFLKFKRYFRLSLFELLIGFKLFIRLFQYILKKSLINKYKSQILLYIWCGNSQNIKFLNFFFNRYSLEMPFEITGLFPRINKNFKFFKNILVLDQLLKKNDYKKFFFNNLYLIQKIGFYHEPLSSGSYNIYNSLNDTKKLIFICLILIQIFKK
jgi:hypothetical protein